MHRVSSQIQEGAALTEVMGFIYHRASYFRAVPIQIKRPSRFAVLPVEYSFLTTYIQRTHQSQIKASSW
jgi:hypothetical protein